MSVDVEGIKARLNVLEAAASLLVATSKDDSIDATTTVRALQEARLNFDCHTPYDMRQLLSEVERLTQERDALRTTVDNARAVIANADYPFHEWWKAIGQLMKVLDMLPPVDRQEG